MSITNHEISSGSEGGQAVLETSSVSTNSGVPARTVEAPTLVRPSCLENQELHAVADLNTPNSRFYVGDNGLCLVEAVEMTHSPEIDLDEVLKRVERKLIKFALERSGGARAGAARLMGISRSRLYRRLHALGLDNGADRDTDGGTFSEH